MRKGDIINYVRVDFNGLIWLAKDYRYSTQYLGSGPTEADALTDMEETIKRYKLKPTENDAIIEKRLEETI